MRHYYIVVLLFVLVCGCQPAGETEEADVPGIRADKDAVVIEAKPDDNFGYYQTLTAGDVNLGDPDADGKYYAYLYFDLSDIPAGSTVTSVELRLYVSNTVNNFGSDFPFGIYEVTSAWSEMGIAWSAQPTTSHIVNFSGPPDGYTGWVSLNLPELVSVVQGWVDDATSNHGFCIKPDFVSAPGQSNGIDFGSRESLYDPNLVVEYTTP